jgi:hypothetical protein
MEFNFLPDSSNYEPGRMTVFVIFGVSKNSSADELHTTQAIIDEMFAANTMIERTYANRTYANRTYANRTYANRTYANRTYANRTYANRTFTDRTYAE